MGVLGRGALFARGHSVTHSVKKVVEVCVNGSLFTTFSLQIVSMVKDRLVLRSSYAAVKIAGLYLLSDILHNAGAPVKHASTYR